MSQLKLQKLLKTLTKPEMLRLGKFLRSPFFNYSPVLVNFYELLKKQHPLFEAKKWRPEKMWAKVQPDKPFSEQRFWRMCSDLSLLVEKYLVQLELEHSETAATHLYIQALGRRDAYPLFEKAIERRVATLEQEEMRNAEWFKEKMELYEMLHSHPLKDKLDFKDNSLGELMDCLDAYFLFQKVSFGMVLLSLERILKKKFDIRYLAIFDEKELPILKENKIYQLHNYSFNLLQKGDESTLFKIKALLFENLHSLKQEDQLLFFSNVLNFAIRKMNRGVEVYKNLVFNWYRLGLEHKIILNNQHLSEIAFQNIVHTACQVKAFEWTKNFIQEYNSYLKEDIRADCVAYNLATYYFYQNDFEQTINILTREQWIKNYQLPSKSLMVRSLFMIFLENNNNYDRLKNALLAFEVFMLRTKLFPKIRLESHLNMVRVLKKLARKIVDKTNKKEIKDWLEQEIKRYQRIISKKWLKELI